MSDKNETGNPKNKKLKSKEKTDANENFDKKESELKKIRTKIINFSKLLWACITWKIILLLVAAIIVANCFIGFREKVQKQINKNTMNYLSSMVTESLEKVRLKINDEYDIIDTLATICENDDEFDIETATKVLNKTLESNGLVGIDLISNDNSKVISLGTTVMYDEEFITYLLSGNKAISAIVSDKNECAEYICMGVPIYKNGNINGAIICEYDIQEFTNIIDESLFGQVGTTFISQEDGTLVLRPDSVGENTNLFDLLDSININNGKSITKLKKSIKNGQSGIITYGSGKHKRYICYDIVPDTNWYSVSIVSADAIEPITKKVSNLAFNFALKLSIIFILYILIILAMDIKVAKQKKYN
jgi:hypothetical protein